MVDIKDEKDLIEKYNAICSRHLPLKHKLPDLSDNELFVWITAKTLDYGRSLLDSIENAELHMRDRKRAERLFSIKENDYLGASL